MTQHTFIVGGNGPFPVDMLRYDECWPVSAEDCRAVATVWGSSSWRRVVKLATSRAYTPTVGRWESFGWIVLSHDRNRSRLHPDDLALNIERFLQPQRVK